MTPSSLILSRGPDAARIHGLRGRFFPSGSAIFFESAPGTFCTERSGARSPCLPADPLPMAVRAVEWLARAIEDDGWTVQRRADSILGFAVVGRAFEDEPDPFGDARVDRREDRLRRERAAWDKGHGVKGVAPDAKRTGGIERHRAAEWTGEGAAREQAEAEARDHG